MNTNKGGSENEQSNKLTQTTPVNFTVISKDKPGSGYFDNSSPVNSDTKKDGGTEHFQVSRISDPALVNSKELHKGPQVDEAKVQQNYAGKESGSGITKNNDADEGNSAEWRSTLSTKEILEGFGGSIDDEKSNGNMHGNEWSGMDYKSDLRQGNISRIDKNDSVGYNAGLNTGDAEETTDTGDAGETTDMRTANDSITTSVKNMDTSLQEIGKENLSGSDKPDFPEGSLQSSQELAELESEKEKLLKKLDKAKVILNKLLADREELAQKTRFLGVGDEVADSLMMEIENQKNRIVDFEREIADIQQQIDRIKNSSEMKPAQSEEREIDSKEKNNDGTGITFLADGRLLRTIQPDEPLLKVIEDLIIQLNNKEGTSNDPREVESLALMAFGRFREEYLKNSLEGGMTQDEALSSWKNLLAGLNSGDEVVIGLSDQGIELDIPAISGNLINVNTAMESGVADDYNMAKTA